MPVMTVSRTPSKATAWRPIEHSLYLGRERLGRYIQTERKRFSAFDAHDRLLGKFSTRAKALDAIGKACGRFV